MSPDIRRPRERGMEEPDLLAYKQMMREKEEVQQILENKLRELDRSNKELDRSNKELEEFAYIASHDLQEPLRKITSFSERLREKLPPEVAPEVQVYLTRMLAATANMRTLIDNLLEFSRVSRNREPFSDVDLNQVLGEVCADLELKIEESQAKIEAQSLPMIEAIPVQMRQLFNNLLTNAIKFRKSDLPPRIRISTDNYLPGEEDRDLLEEGRPHIRIRVSDNGIGFSQEYAQRIFLVFQRLHGKSEFPGSGIGLAICKKIVENHRGRIYAESQPGEGATFSVILPRNQS